MILFGQTYILKRKFAEGSYDTSGKYIEADYRKEYITADCQVITGKELETLNVGRDNLGKIKIYTDEELNIAEAGIDGRNLQQGDRIIFDNKNYEVIQKLKFSNNIINHNEFIAELRND